jgi:hypothetical protein
MKKSSLLILLLTLFLTIPILISAQSKKRKTTKKTTKQTAKTTPTQAATPKTEETPATTVTKKNERPTETPKTSPTVVLNSVYFYEFSQPNFIVSQIFIEHDEAGKGKITFMKQDFDEPVSDPIQLSPVTLERIKIAFQMLNFLNSTENYQDEKRNYSHLGNLKFKMKKDGRERAAAFNWTENKDARLLMDEYYKIANQFVWMFDINVARQNQPLEAPNLLASLEGYIKRNSISDPPQMIPFLTELSNDERIPLIARNHAARIVKEIEKKAEKEKEDKK